MRSFHAEFREDAMEDLISQSRVDPRWGGDRRGGSDIH